MKKILLIFLLFLSLSFVSAINLDVQKISSNEVMILGSNAPAQFEINVTNNGLTDFFSFYTFFGLGLQPSEPIKIESGETKQILLEIFPREDLNRSGYYAFNYFIQSRNGSEIERKLTVRIIDLGEAFEIGAQPINPESESIKVYFQNKVNFNFSNLEVQFRAPFFEFEKKFPLGAYERKEFIVDLDKNNFDNLMAGFYTMNANVRRETLNPQIEGKIEFSKKDLLKTEVKKYGLIISTKIIKKTNEGNVVSDSTTIVKKNILSRAFTSFDPEPSLVEREGTEIYYAWYSRITPGDFFEVTIKTNWLLPFFVILLSVLIVIFAKKYSNEDLLLRKSVSFVKAKGGEFALKVTIIVEAKKYVEKIRILDKLPPLVKIYEKFMGEIPARMDKAKKKIEWDFDHLEEGERRVLSYIIYSKVGVLGKFALPGTIAMFEREGKVKQSSSNKAYFLSRQRRNDDF